MDAIHHAHCYDCLNRGPLALFETAEVNRAEVLPSSSHMAVAPHRKPRSTPRLENEGRASKEMSFLFLPREIRQMIYDYALIVGKVWPYRPLSKTTETGILNANLCIQRPTTNLLKTCRQINAEASPTLYSKNCFILPETPLTIRFFEHTLHSSERKAWVKDAYLSLGASDLTLQERLALNETVTENTSSSRFHRTYMRYLREVSWPRKAGLVLGHLALDSLIIDFRHSICEGGCCERESSAIAALADGFKHGVPANFRLSGLEYWDEDYVEDMVRRWTEEREITSIPLSKGLTENMPLVSGVEKEIEGEETHEESSDHES